jgi:hypothetical protein
VRVVVFQFPDLELGSLIGGVNRFRPQTSHASSSLKRFARILSIRQMPIANQQNGLKSIVHH